MSTQPSALSSADPALPEQAVVTLVERLTAISMALSLENDTDRLLEMILLEAKVIANADGGTLYFRNAGGDALEFAIIRNDTLGIACGGTSGRPVTLTPIALRNAKGEPNYAVQAVYAVLLQKPVNIPDVYNADGFDFEGTRKFDAEHGYRTRSVLTIPMISHKNESLGCLQLVNAKDPASGQVIPFSDNVQRLMQALASQAAVTLDKKKLIDAQRELLESFIKLIARAIDAKSHYTGEHCGRVPVLTEMLAEAACRAKEGPFKDFNLTDEEKYELHIAGWMHDCGKVTTPVHVMDKATKLETIADRIELVRTRFAVLKCDAEIALLKATDKTPAQKTHEERVKQLDDDLAFIAKANIGGEFMSDADIARLQQIAAYGALSENEVYNLSTRRGTLTAEERKIMENHMVQTCQMLESLPFPPHLKRVPEYAGGHHERMDGKGYPKGIKAGTMSIPARMMAVADVFEALTAGDRPYKPAKKLSESMKIIGEMKRTNHLDPVLVDFFITSGVYKEYARRFLPPEQIDTVDEAALLAITPMPMAG